MSKMTSADKSLVLLVGMTLLAMVLICAIAMAAYVATTP